MQTIQILCSVSRQLFGLNAGVQTNVFMDSYKLSLCGEFHHISRCSDQQSLQLNNFDSEECSQQMWPYLDSKSLKNLTAWVQNNHVYACQMTLYLRLVTLVSTYDHNKTK